MKIPLMSKWRILWIAVVLAAAAAVLLVLSVRITTVTVTGNSHYSDEQVEDMLFKGRWSKNTVICYLKNRFGEHERIPFVQDYRISFQSPVSVEVILYEKSMVGYVTYMSSYLYFDKDGIVVESASQRLENIPWITGLKFGHIALYQELPVENQVIFRDILHLTQELTRKEIRVDKIRYDDDGNAVLYIEDIEVKLGGRSDMEAKIAVLADMLPQMEGQSGTLGLDEYDVTNPDTVSILETN